MSLKPSGFERRQSVYFQWGSEVIYPICVNQSLNAENNRENEILSRSIPFV